MALRSSMVSLGSAKELARYIVETPLAAIFALWAVCLPALYFALYGDLIESAKTLSQMTVIVVAYIMIVMAATLSIAFAISYVMWLREKRRWSSRTGRSR